MPPQFDFVFRKWAAEVEADPSLAAQQPYKAIIEEDEAFFERVAMQDPEIVASLLEAFAHSWAGTTPDEFDAEVHEWVTTARQPKLGVPYVELVYQPMLELFDYLKAHEFRVFVCSGGGRDFMRAFAEETWGIFKENVIGSAAEYALRRWEDRPLRSAARRAGLGAGQTRAHLRPDRPTARVRRRQRRRRHRDADVRRRKLVE